jgi:hypothetical protein
MILQVELSTFHDFDDAGEGKTLNKTANKRGW